MQRLQNFYNVPHRSDIYVTGTLSIVFDKPKSHTKLMNANYYENLGDGDSKPIWLDNNSKEGSMIEPNSSIGTVHEGTQEVFGLKQAHTQKIAMTKTMHMNIGKMTSSQGFSGSKSLKKKAPLAPGAISPAVRSQFIERKNMTVLLGTALSNKMSMRQEQQFTREVFVGRPIAMTDKQILKRLNHEVKKSRIFQSVNFQQMPTEIKSKDQNMINMKNKQKKKKGKKKEKQNKD